MRYAVIRRVSRSAHKALSAYAQAPAGVRSSIDQRATRERAARGRFFSRKQSLLNAMQRPPRRELRDSETPFCRRSVPYSKRVASTSLQPASNNVKMNVSEGVSLVVPYSAGGTSENGTLAHISRFNRKGLRPFRRLFCLVCAGYQNGMSSSLTSALCG